MNSTTVKSACSALSLAATLIVMSDLAFAQEIKRQANDTKVAAKEDARGAEKPSDRSTAPKAVAFDADADGNGIMDAVENLSILKTATIDPKRSFDAGLQKQLSASFRSLTPPPHKNTISPCSRYMMQSPEDKLRTDRRVRSKTLGFFGTGPCDPFVSPTLERPADNDYVEVPVLPGLLNIVLP